MKIKHLVSSAAVCGALVAALAIGGTASAAVPVRGTFTPVDPVRILDTRTGLGVADEHVGPLGVGQVIEFDVTDVGGVPAEGAGADVTFTSVAPVRVLDTRDGTGMEGARTGPAGRGSIIQLHVSGEHGVPTDAEAVLLNVTVTDTAGAGYVTAWPCGRIRPVASFLNFVRGIDRANLTPVRIGTNGNVCLFVSEGTQVIADLNGYFDIVAI